MRSNETYDFSVPRRQSYAAILLIAYKLYKVLLRQLFPFLLLFLFGGGSTNKKDFLMYFIIGASILGFIYSVISFFKYYFYLRDDKLIVQKGVFKKTKLEIPFDRIQSINHEQNLIHRVFNVVKLNMDTAGSAGSELQINALDHRLASAISQHILESRTESAQEQMAETSVTSHEKKIIFQLSIPQLLKVGITENHLRSGGFIIFFFFWLWDNLREAGLDVMDRVEEYEPVAKSLSSSLMVVAFLILLFMVVSFLISLIRTVLKYFQLNMYRIGDGFIVESGLFNRREYAAKDHKIQLLSWSQNLLQKWSSIFELKLKQASSVAVSANKSLQVAGLEWQDVQDTKAYLLKEEFPELQGIDTHPVHSYYRFKRIYYWTLFLVPAIGGFFFFGEKNIALGVFLWYLYGLISSHLSYKKKRYGLTDNLLMILGGTFGHRATIVQSFKLQNVSIESTPFQRRRDLASLVLHTASGQLSIPDIGYSRCLELKNYLLYKVESSTRSWF